MLRFPLTIALILLIAVQTFSKCFLILDYQVNKGYIARNLCENRDKPALKCEGRCYLCKKLRKEEKKDQENPERTSAVQFEVLPFSTEVLLPAPSYQILSTTHAPYREDLYSCFFRSFFHPPA